MNNQAYTPALVSENKIFFSIPLYQRLFAWGTAEVSRLLNDLMDHFTKISTYTSPYYLGVMTSIKIENSHSLVDGQQRFTVITLLSLVLRDFSLLWEDYVKNVRLQLVARSDDQQYLENLRERIPITYTNIKMEDALKTIKDFMSNHDNFQKINQKEFSEHVFKKLTFFISELPPNYLSKPASLNRYFELMNSTGRNLEQHEILKVDLLKQSANPDQSVLVAIWNQVSNMNQALIKRGDNETLTEYQKNYLEKIMNCRKGEYSSVLKEIAIEKKSSITILDIPAKEMVNSHNHQEDSEESIISFSEFLLLVLSLSNGTEMNYNQSRVDKLLQIFEEEGPNDLESHKQFYHNLLYYRLLLDYYVIKRDKSTEYGEYSLLHNQSKVNHQLRQYQSMLYVSTDYYHWLRQFLFLIAAEKDLSELENDDLLLKMLKQLDNKLHPCIEFGNTNLLSYGSINRYWFWRLDYYLWEEEIFKQTKDKCVIQYVFRANRSIEHLHPQDQSNNNQWTTASIHAFGNLAMISAGFNSTQGNDAVEVKFARIKQQASSSSLQSIKLYKMYLDALKHTSNGTWNQELANKHEKEMIDVLINSYQKE